MLHPKSDIRSMFETQNVREHVVTAAAAAAVTEAVSIAATIVASIIAIAVDTAEKKNRIRRMVRNFFKDRDCFTLVRPCEDEAMLQNLSNLQP